MAQAVYCTIFAKYKVCLFLPSALSVVLKWASLSRRLSTDERYLIQSVEIVSNGSYALYLRKIQPEWNRVERCIREITLYELFASCALFVFLVLLIEMVIPCFAFRILCSVVLFVKFGQSFSTRFCGLFQINRDIEFRIESAYPCLRSLL